uniref:Putative beta-tubulin polyglutamylase n=1 Tax=Lygus hesperus TaxID=30085 RepID=A0A0A9YAI3_LYGHE
MSKRPEGSNSRSLIRAPPPETSQPRDEDEATISRKWSQIDLLGRTSSKTTTGLSPFRGRRKKRVKPAKFTDTEKEFFQGKNTEERGNEKSVSPIPPRATTSRGTSRSGYTPGRDHTDVAVLVPAERFQRLRPRQTSPGTIEYLAMRLERLKVEPSRNILDLILLRRPFQVARQANK